MGQGTGNKLPHAVFIMLHLLWRDGGGWRDKGGREVNKGRRKGRGEAKAVRDGHKPVIENLRQG